MKLSIENLRVSISKKKIINSVNLNIESGELVSLLGPSGCGKTTLLKAVAGLMPISSGSIYLNGEYINNKDANRRGAVIVFQDLRLFPHLSVYENIVFPMEILKIKKSNRKKRVKDLLEAVQLEGFEDKKIDRLSGGEKQRVAIARALAAEPRILLLDEPFSGLNEKLRLEMGKMIKKINASTGITTILVTHTKEDAFWISDKIALMNDGKILQLGTPEDIYYHPISKEVASYFGKVNYILGEIKEGVFITPFGNIKANVENGFYEALIRPFSIELETKGKYLVTNVVFLGEIAEITVDTPMGYIYCEMSELKRREMDIVVNSKVNVFINTKLQTEFFRK